MSLRQAINTVSQKTVLVSAALVYHARKPKVTALPLIVNETLRLLPNTPNRKLQHGHVFYNCKNICDASAISVHVSCGMCSKEIIWDIRE